MAKNEISDYDETNANNTDISGIAVTNATLIAQIDDIVRAQMGALKRWFRSDLFRLRDSTDQTKLLAFGLSGLTTATTRTLTAPNYDGTIAASARGASIASAATTDIWSATGDFVHITGTTTITSFGATSTAGWVRTIVFDGVLTLTHNATSLILPGAANITTAVGDSAIVRSEGGANSRVVSYSRASGAGLKNGAWDFISDQTLSAAADWRNIDLSTFRDLRIRGFLAPATDGVELRVRTSTNNGSSFDSVATDYSYFRMYGIPSTTAADGVTASQINLSGTGSVGNDIGEGCDFQIDIFNFNKPTLARFLFTTNALTATGAYIQQTGGGLRLNATARNALVIFFSSGNIASGYVTLEGIRA